MLEAAATSVAPPERPPRSPTASFLPPLPTMSGTRSRIVSEPKITAKRTNIGESTESSTDTDTDSKDDSDSGSKYNSDEDGDNGDEEKLEVPIRIGPPTSKARRPAPTPVDPKASHAPDDGIFILFYFLFIFRIIF